MKNYERQSRTAYDNDGRIKAYDLCDAEPGSRVGLITGKGEYFLTKLKGQDDVLAGWDVAKHTEVDGSGEKVIKTVYEAADMTLHKGPYRTGSVVMLPGMEVFITEPNETVVRSLGLQQKL